jgi:hypothetical protein
MSEVIFESMQLAIDGERAWNRICNQAAYVKINESNSFYLSEEDEAEKKNVFQKIWNWIVTTVKEIGAIITNFITKAGNALYSAAGVAEDARKCGVSKATIKTKYARLITGGGNNIISLINALIKDYNNLSNYEMNQTLDAAEEHVENIKQYISEPNEATVSVSVNMACDMIKEAKSCSKQMSDFKKIVNKVYSDAKKAKDSDDKQKLTEQKTKLSKINEGITLIMRTINALINVSYKVCLQALRDSKAKQKEEKNAKEAASFLFDF